jgi:DNA repair photolyase
MLAPIMPGINDDREQLEDLIDAAAAVGATHITPIVLHLRSGVRELFMPWLEQEYPALVSRYHALYRQGTVDGGYHTQLLTFIRQRRRVAWRRHGRPRPRAVRDAGAYTTAERTSSAHASRQLRLL